MTARDPDPLTSTSTSSRSVLRQPDAADGTPAGDALAADAHLALESQALLQGRKAVSISHNGSLYRLQATRLGKLILTK